MDAKTTQKAIIWLCLGHLIADVYSGFLNPIMPFIAAKLGFSMAIATVIISISHICSSMLQPVFGFFADNILKRFFIFSYIINIHDFRLLGRKFFSSAINGICELFFRQRLFQQYGNFYKHGVARFCIWTSYGSFDNTSLRTFNDCIHLFIRFSISFRNVFVRAKTFQYWKNSCAKRIFQIV